MRRRSFQTKLLLAALSAAVLVLVVAGLLFATSMRRQIDARIENTLIAEAQLAAELLGRAEDSSALPLDAQIASLDAEADRLGKLLDARVTFIAANGVVLGDSAEPLSTLRQMENHAERPEIVE